MAMEGRAMQNFNYNLRDRRKAIEPESSLRHILSNLDSLGNNLMGMLWMIHLSLEALQEPPNMDRINKNLQDALKAGNSAKNLMRRVLNSWKPNPDCTPNSWSEPRIKRVKIYYSSRKNGEYLRQVINTSGIGLVAETDNLKHLPAQRVRGVDVVILEYHENDPKIDQWIQESTANPQVPPIYLYFHKFSMEKLWKALHLGVKGCLLFPVQKEQLQELVDRLEDWGRTPIGKGGSKVKRKPHALNNLGAF
jgi:hypothetical protein